MAKEWEKSVCYLIYSTYTLNIYEGKLDWKKIRCDFKTGGGNNNHQCYADDIIPIAKNKMDLQTPGVKVRWSNKKSKIKYRCDQSNHI